MQDLPPFVYVSWDCCFLCFVWTAIPFTGKPNKDPERSDFLHHCVASYAFGVSISFFSARHKLACFCVLTVSDNNTFSCMMKRTFHILYLGSSSLPSYQGLLFFFSIQRTNFLSVCKTNQRDRLFELSFATRILECGDTQSATV